MILINIETTLFLGILFQLFVPCILLNLLLIPLHINLCLYHIDNLLKWIFMSSIVLVLERVHVKMASKNIASIIIERKTTSNLS